MHNVPLNNLSGQHFGRWTAISYSRLHVGGISKWLCVCECGTERYVTAGSLRYGHSKSCGCLNRELASSANRTHGKTDTPEYIIWEQMKARCLRPTNKSYPRYGGKWITIGDDIRSSFDLFLNEVGLRPSNKYQIDRIDNKRGYVIGNMRWATPTENCRNKGNNIRATINGETKCVAEWCEIYNQRYGLVHARIHRLGWDAETAITSPPLKQGQNRSQL